MRQHLSLLATSMLLACSSPSDQVDGPQTAPRPPAVTVSTPPAAPMAPPPAPPMQQEGWHLREPTPTERWPKCPPTTETGWQRDFNRPGREARVVPAFVDGVTIGFKVFAIQDDSWLRDAGFCDGDIVTAINGYSLSSTSQALAIKELLDDEVHFVVEFLRGDDAVVATVTRGSE